MKKIQLSQGKVALVDDEDYEFLNQCLGHFEQEVDAAKAYNEAAIKYRGEFANLNEV